MPQSKIPIHIQTARSGSDFVGLKITQSERSVTFPMGYALPSEGLDLSKVTKGLQRQILNLVKSIHLCSVNRRGERVSSLNGEKKNDFPVKSMLFIIEDFLERGTYYTEKETLYAKANGGKISWNRTIKSIKPVISESGIAFLNFIIRKNRIQENQLITELHKYCVFKSFEIFGFLYTAELPEKGLLDESDISKNKKYYAQFLQDKIDQTHLESNIELFANLLDFINGFDSESETTEAAFGTTSFQVVWESMVDSAFGTVSQYQKETYFYPHTKWSFKRCRNSPLRPDTIMILGEDENRKCVIIDSKYYSYSAFENNENDELEEAESDNLIQHGSIPGSDSIQKQITYAQYIDSEIKSANAEKRAKFRFPPENIFNVFILPSDSCAGEKLQYIGCATSDWHDGSKNYHTVHAVSLDTKFLIENFGKKNENLQKELFACLLSNSKDGRLT